MSEIKQLEGLRASLTERVSQLLAKEKELGEPIKETRESIVSLAVILEKINLMRTRQPRFPDTPTTNHAQRLQETFGNSESWRHSEAKRIHQREKTEERSIKKKD